MVKAAAVNIEEDGALLGGRFCRGPDVEVEAILADVVVRGEFVGPGAGAIDDAGRRRFSNRFRAQTSRRNDLSATGAEMVRAPHALPGGDRPGGAPAQIAHRRSCERNSLEGEDSRVFARDAGNKTATSLDRLLESAQRRRECHRSEERRVGKE